MLPRLLPGALPTGRKLGKLPAFALPVDGSFGPIQAGEHLLRMRPLAALVLELAAQIGDEGEETVWVVAHRSRVSGPPQLAFQKPLGSVALCSGPLGRLLGHPDPLPRSFKAPLSAGGALSPVLGLPFCPFSLPARPSRLGASGLCLSTDRFRLRQLRCSPLPVGALPLGFGRPLAWSSSGLWFLARA